MRTQTKIVLGTAVALLGGAALVGTTYAKGGMGHGPHGMGGPGMLMEQFDTNSDQRLTREEITGVVDERLARFDTNGDGSLSLEEFQPLLVELMRPRIVDGFQFLDDDGDGLVTREEIDRPVERMLGRLDRNEDGTITADEMRPGRHGGWRGHDGPKGRGQGDDD